MNISLALDHTLPRTPLRVTRTVFVDPIGEWEYVTCEPPPDLADVASLFWSTRGHVRFTGEAILPRPGMELIVNLGFDYAVTNRGAPPRRVRYRDAWISPMQESPLVVVPETARASFDTDLVAVTLRPQGVHALLALPLAELTNCVIELEDLVAPAAVRALRARLADRETGAARFELFVAFLRALRERSVARPSARVAEAIDAIECAPGEARIEHLCRDLAVSPKHLRTLFEREIGLSPKRYARLLRFTGVIADVGQRREIDWAAAAQRHGFFDQAHLSREFRAFSGVTPTEYARERSPEGTALLEMPAERGA